MWFFLALVPAASTNCRLNGDGLTSVADPDTGSGGESGTGGTRDAGFASSGTGGAGGATGSGGVNASGGATGSGGTSASGGAIGSGGTTARGGATGTGGGIGSGGIINTGGATDAADASSTGGVTSVGGIITSGGVKGAGGVAGAGGSNPDGATERPSVPSGDGPPNLLVDTSADRRVDARIADAPAPSDDTNDAAAVDAGSPMTLVWSDEFNGAANSGVDTTKWSYITWDPGHVNNEAQKYTNRLENVFQDGAGHLVIRALDTPSAGSAYTSGRIESNGHFTFQFGRVEVRAKLPAGIGSFPGIVAMGSTGSWPQCGELALMEQYGQDKSWFYVSATAGGADDTGNVKYTFPDATTASLDFHVYSLDWYTDHIVFQVDGTEITHTTFAASSPFYSIPEYLILDLALGGTMGGTINPNAFPMDMVVDYVRVYSF
jgi:beta-glucanase (GH16 family)